MFEIVQHYRRGDGNASGDFISLGTTIYACIGKDENETCKGNSLHVLDEMVCMFGITLWLQLKIVQIIFSQLLSHI